MKYFSLSLLSIMILLSACKKDEINTITDTTSGATGGGSSSDTTATTDYDRTVTVVFSSSDNATVSGTGGNIAASISGNDVTIRNSGDEKVMYRLSGTTGDGFLKIYSGRKQGITLNSVSITNSRGAAINVQGLEESPSKGKRVDVVLNGSSTLADGSAYSLTPDSEDEKAAFFSEGQIVFSGSGTLSVNATGKAGITSDDWLGFNAGTIQVSASSGHGVRGKDYILVSGGKLNISVSADGKKGMSSDSLVCFNGGETTISITGNTLVTTEGNTKDTSGTAGIKADQLFEMNDGTLTITNSGKGGKGISCDGNGYFRGGTVNISVTGTNFGSSSSGGGPGGGHGPGGGGSQSDNSVGAKGIKFDGDLFFSGSNVSSSASKHEAIESKGNIVISDGYIYAYSSDDAINAASNITISGGYVCAHSTNNDGIDANGDMYLSGGLVYAIGSSSPEEAIDVNINEGGQRHELVVSGGTIIAIGGISNGFTRSQSCYRTTSWTRNVWYSLTVGDNTIAFKTPSSGGSGIVFSAPSQPTVKNGVTVENGTEVLNNMINLNATCSGGTTVNLSSY